MIKRLFTEEELYTVLDTCPADIFTGKIKALCAAYGFSYDFLKFYIGENAVIAVYYASAVICGEADEEVYEFCKSLGVSDFLIQHGGSADSILYIMEYKNKEAYEFPICTNTPYEKVYEILKDGFEIEFDGWYTDTCHNVRHGISTVYTFEDKATATEMFSIEGISLISLVAVKKEHRGKNYGGSVVKALSHKLSQRNRVYVICEKELMPFYISCGYEKTAECYNKYESWTKE